MYCSVKFLSPMVTGGLPLPGCADDWPPVDVLLLSLEPQAANERASAAASNAAMLRNQVRDVIGSPREGPPRGLPERPRSAVRRSPCVGAGPAASPAVGG